MAQYLRAYHERADQSSDTGPIRFIASTEGVGRDGLIINADGWQLDNFRANPVVLWAHDYGGGRPPIGRADVEVSGKKLMADVTFDPDDEFAQQIERKYRSGFLSAVSVGWDTIEMAPSDNPNMAGRVTKADLLDISAVPVPGDPSALKERQMRSIADVARWMESVIETDDDEDPEPDEAAWTGTAVSMARLYLADASESEPERKRTYKRLARAYERMGKTAPEYLPLSTVDRLSLDELRGLFLANEPGLLPELFTEARAGAVLSSRNHNDLETAVTLIQGVLARAVKTEEPETTPAETTDNPAADDAIVRLHKLFQEVKK